MSPVGININTKANGRMQSRLSINQATRPLTANMAQVGLGKTFSGPLPGRMPPPSALSLDLPLAQRSKYPTTRGRSPGCRRADRLRAGLWRSPHLPQGWLTQHTALPGLRTRAVTTSWVHSATVTFTGGCLLQSLAASYCRRAEAFWNI